MKTRRWITLLTTGILATTLLIACSPKQESAEQPSMDSSSEVSISTSESSSDTEQSSFNADDYLTIDTSKITDFELSPMVKSAVGTYSGVVANSWSTKEYQVKINEDGTYFMLSRELFPRDEETILPKADPRPYLDSSNRQQSKQLETTIDGKLYEFSDFHFTRGVLVEKYGQLYFAPLNDQDIFPYLDQNGNLDFVKGILVSTLSYGTYDRVIDTTSDYEIFLTKTFDYSKTLPDPSPYFVIDSGKLTIDKVEVPKSSNVDSFLTTNLNNSFAKEKILKQIESANDVLQFARSKVPIDTYTIKALSDFSDVYTSDNQRINAKYAVTLKDEKHTLTAYDETEIYVYYEGTIYYGKELNGKFVLDGAI
ncbi:hypothetical protein BU202_08715 [Streptococcus cuniculi]|uniref:Lipoprotein n=1 Tax=Streptococcus cuniculi TaxID=1432788 RepID=A0A1Q8E5T8_9STRE|nr:hypothetical protein [Streptococcus cuniculi]OLF47154.1 hypothetical protein BU202_08715 [Streptococcus cuniculi]